MFKQIANDDFTTLIKSLRLKDSFELAAPLIATHLETVHGLLCDFIVSDPWIDQGLREALISLPQESIGRLLASPYLCELLLIAKQGAEAIRIQILLALVAEVRLVAPQFEHPLKPDWTIDGDVVLDEEIRARFPALSSKCGIRINYQSYVHNTGKVGIGGYTYELGLRHLERLETALSLIRQVSKSAESMVQLFTTTIQVRQNLNRSNVVNSSTHTSIGLIRCDNFHKLHNDLPEVVDMLVHESIHQYLHLFEEQHFSFVENLPPSLADERLFASPWSGNPLDIRSYTHAILVWFGLWHFWGDFVASGVSHPEISTEQAREKQAEALFGFVNSHSVLDNLKEAQQYLRPEYSAVVPQIQAELQRIEKAV